MGYRFFFCQYAERRGLKGWIRNNPDGRVEIVLQAAEAELADAEAFMRKGPPTAEVGEVMSFPVEEETVLGRFRLKY